VRIPSLGDLVIAAKPLLRDGHDLGVEPRFLRGEPGQQGADAVHAGTVDADGGVFIRPEMGVAVDFFRQPVEVVGGFDGGFQHGGGFRQPAPESGEFLRQFGQPPEIGFPGGSIGVEGFEIPDDFGGVHRNSSAILRFCFRASFMKPSA